MLIARQDRWLGGGLYRSSIMYHDGMLYNYKYKLKIEILCGSKRNEESNSLSHSTRRGVRPLGEEEKEAFLPHKEHLCR